MMSWILKGFPNNIDMLLEYEEYYVIKYFKNEKRSETSCIIKCKLLNYSQITYWSVGEFYHPSEVCHLLKKRSMTGNIHI